MSENHRNGEKKQFSTSALPDFAQIYSFLEHFGWLLRLPPVTLSELEEFLETGYQSVDCAVSFIHWKLLNNVCRRDERKAWQRTAVKFGRRCGLYEVAVPYSELSIQQRAKLFRLICEEQFDSNPSFKLQLKKQVLPTDLLRKPFGVDREGQRHWLLQDAAYDMRLYGESGYDEAPPQEAVWSELARSLDDLSLYISKLESRSLEKGGGGGENAPNDIQATPTATVVSRETSLSASEPRGYACSNSNHIASNLPQGTSTSEVLEASREPPEASPPARAAKSSRGQRTPKKAQKKRKASEEEEVEVVGGCMKCRRDVNYDQMLLCDSCDNECHTYCQYPVLWAIPEGHWYCPACTEKQLLSDLKVVFLRLSEAQFRHERAMERKQRSQARLQRSGVLIQNIIMEEDDSNGRRSRRSRKDVDYAKLNDFYLPPLGPQDTVGNRARGGEDASSDSLSGRHGYSVPYGTRSSRRVRGFKADEESDPEEEMLPDLSLEKQHSWYADADDDADSTDKEGREGLLTPSDLSSEDAYLSDSEELSNDVIHAVEGGTDQTGYRSQLMVCLPRHSLAGPPTTQTGTFEQGDSVDTWMTYMCNHVRSEGRSDVEQPYESRTATSHHGEEQSMTAP